MSRESRKAAYEREVFERFVTLAGLKERLDLIKNGDANQGEPDLICQYLSGQIVGFELGRLIDPNLAQAVNRWEPINGEYIRTGDPSADITRRKIKKTYLVAFPVELLLYKENPIITPDDVILPTIRRICHLQHRYLRVWFMGDSTELLYERS